jgi:hypothetical protein
VSIRKLKEIHTAAHPAKMRRDASDVDADNKHADVEKLFSSLAAEKEVDE